MDHMVHGAGAKMRPERRESKECVGRTKVSSKATTRGIDEEAGIIAR